MACCQEYTSLGCFDSCAEISTNTAATMDGTYLVCYDAAGMAVCKGMLFETGTTIKWQHFGRSAGSHTVTIKDPNGNLLGCYKLTTQIHVEIVN